MAKVSAGENSKKLKNSKNQPMSPKKFKGSQFMSPKRSQNSGEKLWNAFHALMNVISELEETKVTVELKKDEISEEQLNKIIALKNQAAEETEQIMMPYFKKIIVELKGTKIEKLSTELKKLAEVQGEKIQELCKKLKSGTGTEEDQNKLKIAVKGLAKEYSKELTNYVSDSNPIMLYTAVIGVGLAVGLVASTILEHTTRLSMLAIIIIATASAFVAGCATYATLRPNTKIDESKEVQIKSSHHSLS
ncbi:hypothetical protein HGO53_01955 [Wolbachia endosymbiont of Diaphorina citri]|jgi:hypothetical protein|uniref:hypothetical protein n=1 Tax=Wolbachia endosymbiont of Diaphorina citri TaxID=116598 RepID=UPI000311DA40|nr:hypothetical protein [Wolbachia endosymbiont of Diaphorina citri]QJT94106.1 hypothetical protein HGO48_01245 [Wolbachia endosymbiont of Diaphorina citri]QJT95347.1 hypothetical protein HGO49_01245 [Wolbachia endosymbiont of Diaphorina citri]QJT96709.1 hypothetical protein HGO53_01955 [Wolbachia endosymbiont of Diaphorina citri]QLK11005.1 hypothetical protein FK497_01285 [Wolbachia endosymbiont of Diaphorina citri]QXY87463.1 hypothetical protein GZ064_06510 [Wolbachia endosymbiont of Diaphor